MPRPPMERRPDKLPQAPTSSRNEEWRWTPTTEELLSDWVRAFRFTMAQHAGATSPDRRERAYEVIHTIREGLSDLGVEDALLEPLAEIETALVEADRGIADPLFKPSYRKGRPRMPLWQMEIVESAALAMELYMLAGIKKQAAATRVAVALQRLQVPLGGKWDVPPWKAIAEWRDGLSRVAGGGRHSTDIFNAGAAYSFDLARQNLQRRVRDGALDPTAAAEHQLKRIEGFVHRSGK